MPAIKKRWLILAAGVAVMLFAGILYAWSILKVPIGEEFGWPAQQLAVNFTVSISFFCLGGIFAGLVRRKIGVRCTNCIAAVLTAVGFIGVSRLSGKSCAQLYLFYGVLSGLGIGIVYNSVISGVSPWFPEKSGVCSGLLMMGFGSSTLFLGKTLESLMRPENLGWRDTFFLLGCCMGAILLIAAFILCPPGENEALPEPKKREEEQGNEPHEYTTREMLCRSSFYRFFVYSALCSMVGNSVFSCARDFALSVGASAAAATALVGLCSVCNGLGRVICGTLYDTLGRRRTMIAANLLTIAAPAVALCSVVLHSVPVCVCALALLGMSYGCPPTIAAAFTRSFYGRKNYASNFSFTNSALMPASFAAPVISQMVMKTGSYRLPFVMLIGAAAVALLLNLSLRKP